MVKIKFWILKMSFMKWKLYEHIISLKTKVFSGNKAKFVKKYINIIILVLFLIILINNCGKGAGPIEGTPEGPESLKFIGTGVNITDAFQSNGGSTMFEIQHDGISYFTVGLLDNDSGEEISLLANKSGFFNETVIKILIPKNYIFEIDADGNWIIIVSGNIKKISSNYYIINTYSGKESDITPVFASSGLTIFEMTHHGSSDFIVWLLNSNKTNNRISLLANKSGLFYGIVAEGLGSNSSDSYKLQIEADGDWFISVSKSRI